MKLSLDPRDPGRFFVQTDKDVSMFGWEVYRKNESYFMEMSPWNMFDLYEYKDRVGLNIEIEDQAKPIIELIRNDMRRYQEAHRIRLLPDADIDDMWEDQGFLSIFPKLEADTYQKRVVLWLLKAKKAGVFMEQGTGKTPVGIFLLGKLLHDGLIKKPIVFAPISLLNNTAWFKDLERFSEFIPINLRKNPENVVKNEIHFINYDKLHHWCFQKTKTAEHSYDKNNFFEINKFDAIYYDESSTLKSHSSYRSQAFVKIARHAKYIALASGTPCPTDIFQIWTQMRSIGSVLGDTYSPFVQRYGVQRSVGPVMKWFPRPGAEQEIRQRIHLTAYFVRRDDVLKLPPRVEMDIPVVLHPEHRALYDQIEEDYIAAVHGLDAEGNPLEGTARVTHEVTMRMKLLQITSGFITVEDKNGEMKKVTLLWNAKLDKLDELINKHVNESPDNNIIIWCSFRWEVETIYKRYMEKASYLYGGISEKKRNALLQFWLEDKACRVMVAIPAAAKFGHTWLKANLSIYFSGTEDYENYAQSRDRNYRRGQTRSVTECKLITTNTVEKVIWKAITNKGRLDDFMKRYALERAKSSKIT